MRLEFENALAESLRSNQLDPKLLYVTPRQAELWRQVFLKHSPIHANPEFGRIYREAFAHMAKQAPMDEAYIVGLGCGTGIKEAAFCAELKSRGRKVLFSPIDISVDLIGEAKRTLAAAGATYAGGMACDMENVDRVAQWIDETGHEAPIFFTFFGVVPNMTPSLVLRLFRAILRPGDTLVVSAHLAPISEDIALPDAMRKVLPQYDNAETLAWLLAGLEEWGLSDRLEPPRMEIGEVEGMPAFVAMAKWKTAETSNPLRVFHSVRYTPNLFEKMLSDGGFHFELLAITGCREEGIWAVRLSN